jgi:hypothetical protein
MGGLSALAASGAAKLPLAPRFCSRIPMGSRKGKFLPILLQMPIFAIPQNGRILPKPPKLPGREPLMRAAKAGFSRSLIPGTAKDGKSRIRPVHLTEVETEPKSGRGHVEQRSVEKDSSGCPGRLRPRLRSHAGAWERDKSGRGRRTNWLRAEAKTREQACGVSAHLVGACVGRSTRGDRERRKVCAPQRPLLCPSGLSQQAVWERLGVGQKTQSTPT